MTLHSAPYFDLDTAPMAVDQVTLTVRDLDRVASFYVKYLGLKVHAQTATRVELGADVPFLVLLGDPEAAKADPSAPGLFHVAYLLPSRTDLSSWLAHMSRAQMPPWGASDHNVSEAIYLNDPEGNGIEVYVDRPVSGWHRPNGDLNMPSYHLDFSDLPKPGAWDGAPGKTRVGHVHLQTPDIAEAEAFWTGLGMEVTARYPGGSFFGSGGYHHNIAANVWNSRGRAVQSGPKTGLTSVAFCADSSLAAHFGTHTAPSGVDIILNPKGH